MTILTATCATLAALIAQPAPPATISLKGKCPAIKITSRPAKRVAINAGGSDVAGLVITGGNIRWRGGTIRAPAGAHGTSKSGYGVLLDGASDVRFDGVTFTDANRGIVAGNSKRITVAGSRFRGIGQDGMIVSSTVGLTVVRNTFSGTLGKPSQCVVVGVISYSVAKRDCAGAWTDGYHADAIQMRNGVTDALIEGNTITGPTQGITQMDSMGDAPLERIRILRNAVRTDRPHKITTYGCLGCTVAFNVVGRAPGSKVRPVIIAPGTDAHDNVVEP